MSKWYKEKGIVHHLVGPKAAPSNPTERMNQTIIKMVSALMIQSGLPGTMCVEASLYAVWLINRTVSKAADNRTPFEKFYGYRPNVSKIRVFGSIGYAYIHPDLRGKLDNRSEVGYFIGYADGSNGYKMYFPQYNMVKFMPDVVINEDIMYKDRHPNEKNIDKWTQDIDKYIEENDEYIQLTDDEAHDRGNTPNSQMTSSLHERQLNHASISTPRNTEIFDQQLQNHHLRKRCREEIETPSTNEKDVHKDPIHEQEIVGENKVKEQDKIQESVYEITNMESNENIAQDLIESTEYMDQLHGVNNDQTCHNGEPEIGQINGNDNDQLNINEENQIVQVHDTITQGSKYAINDNTEDMDFHSSRYKRRAQV